MRIGGHIVIDRIFEEYGIPQLLNKQFNAKEAGLFRDLVAYSIITESNVGQYYPDYAYNHPLFDKASGRSIAVDKTENIIGKCEYQETDDAITIYHTEVNHEYSGNGIAKRLVYKIFEEADRECKKIVATCSYADAIINS